MHDYSCCVYRTPPLVHIAVCVSTYMCKYNTPIVLVSYRVCIGNTLDYYFHAAVQSRASNLAVVCTGVAASCFLLYFTARVPSTLLYSIAAPTQQCHQGGPAKAARHNATRIFSAPPRHAGYPNQQSSRKVCRACSREDSQIG